MATLPNEIALPPTAETMLDERIVRISIEINGEIKVYENIFIAAVGVKYGNPLDNEAEITIYNLDKATQDYLLTETSPYNANWTPKTITLEAGRKSYGTSVIYKGNVIYAGVTQPPDIGVVLKCLTANFYKNSIIARTQPYTTTVSQVFNAFAQEMQLVGQFEATDKVVTNFVYGGSLLQQAEAIAALGQFNLFVDDDTIIMKDNGIPLKGGLRQLSASNGMIGIPEFTERGVRVKFFVDNKTRVGGGIDLRSELYPAVNGIYVIYQLAFIITNRLVPFYYIADCIYLGTNSEESTGG